MPKFNKDGTESEHHIQKTVIEWVKIQPIIKDYIFSIPNEFAPTAKYGRKLVERGLMKGASDLFVAIPNSEYHGAFLELKSAKGKLSPYQIKFISNMESVGYFCTVCWGIDDAISTLKWYINLK